MQKWYNTQGASIEFSPPSPHLFSSKGHFFKTVKKQLNPLKYVPIKTVKFSKKLKNQSIQLALVRAQCVVSFMFAQNSNLYPETEILKSGTHLLKKIPKQQQSSSSTSYATFNRKISDMSLSNLPPSQRIINDHQLINFQKKI